MENHSLCSFRPNSLRLAKQGAVKCRLTRNCWLIAGGCVFVGSEQGFAKVSTSLAGQSAHTVTIIAKYSTLFLSKTCDLCVRTRQIQSCLKQHASLSWWQITSDLWIDGNLFVVRLFTSQTNLEPPTSRQWVMDVAWMLSGGHFHFSPKVLNGLAKTIKQ